jgi:hypothetical protein
VTLTVGRCQLGNSVDISTLSRSGNQVTLAGTFFPTVDGDTAQSDAVRQQLNGMLGNADEMAFPVTFTVDPRIDGFYQVTGADISERPSSPTTGAFGYSLQLQRIGGGFGNPTFEVSCTNVTRTNAHGIPGAPLVIVPGDGSSLTYDITGFGSIGSFDTRATADGIGVYLMSVGDPNGRAYRFDVTPADYYRATCSIETLFGSTWFPVIGRQIPLSYQWRISNGLVRFTSGTAGTQATMELWNGSAWASWPIGYWDGSGVRKIGRTAPGYTNERAIAVTVLRNSPEQVVIRQQAFDGVVTWTIARGARHATISWSVANNTLGPYSFGVGLVTGQAGTAISGTAAVHTTAGVSATQALFACAGATTAGGVDTANTRIRNTAAALTGAVFAGGVVTPPPSGINALSAQAAQMLAGLNCRQRAIAR